MKREKAESFFRLAMAYAEKEDTWLEWLRNIEPFDAQTVQRFLAEYCWVVYASGFRASVIEMKFPALFVAYWGFEADDIRKMRSVEPALKVINNRRKASCFLRGAQSIIEEGYEEFKQRVRANVLEVLESLPGIGPITAKHLARNVGLLDVAKDDIWLQRLVGLFDAKDEDDLVFHLACTCGEKKGTVDGILWRFCADNVWKVDGFKSLEEFVNQL